MRPKLNKSSKAMLMDSLVKGWRVALQSLIQARQTQEISTRDLAARLGINHEELIRVETMEVMPNLELILDYAYELNQTLELSVREFTVSRCDVGSVSMQASVFGSRPTKPFHVDAVTQSPGNVEYVN